MEIPSQNTVHEVFLDFKGRRLAFIKALTADVDEFFEKCDPEGPHLCLYGLPNETWEVTLPVEEVPSEFPEPALGINFARDGMRDKDWLSFVAAHSDSWLLSVAFYFGVRFGFGKSERMRLFEKINDLPTVYEVVSGNVKPPKDQSGNYNSSTSSSSGMSEQPKAAVAKEEGEDEEDEQGATLCGACGGSYASPEFWICCDLCEKWFHGKCVKITPAKAEQIMQYKCPFCNNKKVKV